MAFTVVIEPRALHDIQKGIDFYDERRVGLGEIFKVAVDQHVQAIAKNPFYQLRYKDYRALPIKNFPYIILFYISERLETVFITAVFQTKQSIKKRPR